MARGYHTQSTRIDGTSDQVVAAAKAGYLIRVYAIYPTGSASAILTLKNTTATTTIMGPIAYDASFGSPVPYNPDGWCQTLVGDGLTANTSTGTGNSTITWHYEES